MSTDTQVSLLGAPTLPSVNLLPPELEEARKFRRVQVGLGSAVVAAVALVVALDVNAHASVHHAQSQLADAQAQTTILQAQLFRLQNVRTTEQLVASDKGLLAQAMGQEIQWSHVLNDLSLRIPDNVWLTNFSANETSAGGGSTTTGSSTSASSSLLPAGIGTISFAGIAFTHDDVATWLEALAKEHGFVNPYFSSSTAGTTAGHHTVTFASSVTLTPDILSNRFTTGGF